MASISNATYHCSTIMATIGVLFYVFGLVVMWNKSSKLLSVDEWPCCLYIRFHIWNSLSMETDLLNWLSTTFHDSLSLVHSFENCPVRLGDCRQFAHSKQTRHSICDMKNGIILKDVQKSMRQFPFFDSVK